MVRKDPIEEPIANDPRFDEIRNTLHDIRYDMGNATRLGDDYRQAKIDVIIDLLGDVEKVAEMYERVDEWPCDE